MSRWHSDVSLQVYTCTFVEPASSAIQQAKVKVVSKEWGRYANIKFDFESAAGNPLEAIIRISFDERLGLWSTVGKITFDLEVKFQGSGVYMIRHPATAG